MNSLIILLAVSFSGGIWLYFIKKVDRIEPEPIISLLKIGLLAGLFSLFFAGLFNGIFQSLTGIKQYDKLNFINSLLFALFVGFNEEFFKSFFTFKFLSKF